MKSIKRRFDNISIKNHYWSSYVCFAEAIKNQNFSKPVIQLWFSKLVNKDDYDKKEKKEILKHIYNLNSSEL